MPRLLIFACILARLLITCIAENLNDTMPISIFRSVRSTHPIPPLTRATDWDHQRPDLAAPILKPITHNRERQAPGFYFVAPYQNEQEGLYIYDNDLVS